jgi:membrane fusion protein, multidrug efflux system
MPTESRSPVSRRRLSIFGLVASIVAVLVVVTGIRAREDTEAKLQEWTDNQAIPTVAVVLPDPNITVAIFCDERAGLRPGVPCARMTMQ